MKRATTSEIMDDFVGMLKVQGGNVFGKRPAHHRPVLPRTEPRSRLCSLGHRPARRGGSTQQRAGRHDLFRRYRRSAVPDPVVPREFGIKGAVFADAGTLFGYKGPTNFTGHCTQPPVGRGLSDDRSRSSTTAASARRSARACCGSRRSARSASTTLIPSPRISTTRPSTSGSRAVPPSDDGDAGPAVTGRPVAARLA